MRARRAHSKPTSVADVEGPWVDSKFRSGSIERCKRGWNTPVTQLTNELLATYLRQQIAASLVLPEALERVAMGYVDDTELYEDELANALRQYFAGMTVNERLANAEITAQWDDACRRRDRTAMEMLLRRVMLSEVDAARVIDSVMARP